MDHAAAFGAGWKVTETLVPGTLYTMTREGQEAGLLVFSFPSEGPVLSAYPETEEMTVLPPEPELPSPYPDESAVNRALAGELENLYQRLSQTRCPYLLHPQESRIVPWERGSGCDLLLKAKKLEPIHAIAWTQPLVRQLGEQMGKALDALETLGLDIPLNQACIFRDAEGNFLLADLRTAAHGGGDVGRTALAGLIQKLTGSCKKTKKLPWMLGVCTILAALFVRLYSLGVFHEHQWVAADCENMEIHCVPMDGYHSTFRLPLSSHWTLLRWNGSFICTWRATMAEYCIHFC